MKKNIIEIPVQKFEVYSEDCCDCLNYDESEGYCHNLEGEGWRLPTREEQLEMYKHKEELGLKDTLCWSSTEYNTTHAYAFAFFNGIASANYKNNTYSVRAVRTIK